MIVNVYSAVTVGSIAVIILMIIQVNNYAVKAAATRLHAHDMMAFRSERTGTGLPSNRNTQQVQNRFSVSFGGPLARYIAGV